jgi:predicted peptidase
MTVIPNEGHCSWVRYYNDRRFYDWLLQHRRLSAAERAERDRYPTTAPSQMLADASRHPEVLKPGEHWLEFATRLGGQPYAMRYCVSVPQGYSPDRGSWPMMVYLHPDDVRDTDQSMVFQWGSGVDPRKDASARAAFPMIGVVPQLPHDRQWNDPDVMAMTQALLDEVGRRYRVDADRAYVVGLQGGANGAWSLAMQSPGRFAAVVAYQGGAVKPEEAGQKLRGVAARIMAPSSDAGAVTAGKQMAEAMKKAGGVDVKLDQVADAQDPSRWTPFYTDPELVKWLLTHRRGAMPARMVKVE